MAFGKFKTKLLIKDSFHVNALSINFLILNKLRACYLLSPCSEQILCKSCDRALCFIVGKCLAAKVSMNCSTSANTFDNFPSFFTQPLICPEEYQTIDRRVRNQKGNCPFFGLYEAIDRLRNIMKHCEKCCVRNI